MLDASEMLIIDTRRFFQFLNKGQKQYQMEIRFCPIIVHYKSRISKYRTLINTRNYTELFWHQTVDDSKRYDKENPGGFR